MRLVPLLTYLLLIAFHQAILNDLTSIHGVAINAVALITLAVALYKDEFASLWFGMLAGLVSAVPTPAVMGWSSLVLAALGLLGYHVRGRLNLDSLAAKLWYMAGGLLAHNLAMLVMIGTTDFWFRLVTVALPGVVYTLVVAWIFFLFKDGRLSSSRVKAMY
jgi:cell shape-determining protein MreD